MNAVWAGLLAAGGIVYAGFVLTAFRGVLKLRRAAYRQLALPSSPLPTATIIIAAHNEEAEIKATLASLLDQDYPPHKFEIIVVDDRSTDGTARIVNAFADNDPRVRLLTQLSCDPRFSPKKQALSMGLAAAGGTLIALTDADCRYARGWLRALVESIPTEGGMAVGQARFEIGTDPPLWQRIQALDFAAQGILSAGLVAAGVPFNCSGASLAFSRSAYDKVEGWQGTMPFISGDDELLMGKMHRAGVKIAAVPYRQTVVKTRPPATLSGLWQQRIRWGSKGTHYPLSRKSLLAGVILFYMTLTIWPLPVLLGASLVPATAAFGGKMLLDVVLMLIGQPLFGDRIRVGDFLLAELLHPPVITAMAVAGAFGTFRWKGTTYRSRGTA